MPTIHDVLSELRATSLDERDKGDKFERLIKAYLTTDPEWTARFSNVWLWTEWPGRAGRTDTGIDLVAEHRDREGLAAIQCKLYEASHKVAKSDIDSFVSASARSEFTARYVFDTAAGWTGNAEETLEGVVQRIDINYLDDARIDWSQYSWSKPDQVVVSAANRLRTHQKAAIDAVHAGFAESDRGKLIMACGTGKTFTSLKIAEQLVGEGGSVLFLVPSIQLLSQSLREWMAQADVDIRPFAVCSDVRVGRRTAKTDDGDLSTVDLTEPATTDAQTLYQRSQAGRHAKQRMTVVFATYQSIDVVAQAQQLGLGAFDLIVCDEAHRTTGVTLAGQDDSSFVKVHDGDYLKAARRLYMTATPRVFGEDVKRKATEAEAVLADMGDETMFGPEFHRLGFGEAVEQDLLTDYKVLVLAVDEEYVAGNFQTAMAQGGEIQLGDAAKLIGCWNGLAKNYGPEHSEGEDRSPMRRAVAFAKDIRSSKAAAEAFPALVERALEDAGEDRNHVRVQAVHVDGTMGVHERNTYLDWLKADPGEDRCRVLTNARCLSEGVDVPALDTVMFLTPRGSQVDVVQSVGRVMRKDPTGRKKLGYIILPVVVPSGVAPSEALNDNKRYQVVWQVLQALRSHDDRFHAMINSVELNKGKSPRLDIVDVTPRPPAEDAVDVTGETDEREPGSEQLALDYGFDGFRDAMYARIVRKVGERRYWETWAKDVADIAQAHITRIHGLLADPASPAAKEFDEFLKGLRGNLNESITAHEAIEMLAQHLVTRPVFEALFANYNFTAHNPVAKTMELMLASLDEHALEAENQQLEKFYSSVRRRVEGVTDASGKQRVIVELYDKFFATAFKKTVDRLGIVYTPIEIVDFILRSVDDVLREEFGQGLTSEGVHILDGFTGTGTFIVRLLQSGLITPHDLARKYANELHANEILLLAYYIAAVNIETTYAENTSDGEAAPFPGLVLTDTFQSYEDGDRDDLDIFPENNERITRQRQLPITVIVGNPPYSVGQTSANDDNANTAYPSIDAAIRATYAAQSATTSIRGLYDSYVRAIKWASLRIGSRGVIAYVTNGGFLTSNSADGMRKSLYDEFAAIHVFNLRGNRRNAGAEGRPIFEAYAKGSGGSIAGIAIVVMVKDDTRTGGCTLRYAQVSDFTTAHEKVAEIVAAGSILGTNSQVLVPDEHGDWLNQRRSDFGTFMPLYERGESSIFASTSKGLTTNRDVWVYNASKDAVSASVETLVDTYTRALQADVPQGEVPRDPRVISWSRRLLSKYAQRQPLTVADDAHRVALYRPFLRQHVYFSADLNEDRRRLPEAFPTPAHPNHGVLLTGVSSHYEFCAIATDAIPDLHLLDTGQFFARWRYEPIAESDDGTLDFDTTADQDGDVVDGYRRIDNVTDTALQRFQTTYPALTITKDDVFHYVYGVLHSPTYREAYAADLKKSLPRIPFVADFTGFAAAGRDLYALHRGYETAQPYPLDGLNTTPVGDAYEFYAVGEKRMRYSGSGNDHSSIRFNDRITLAGIPEEAHRYRLGSRSAVDWIIDRYHVKTDKNSGIVNDPNAWAREVGDPRYILDLLARVVTVSVETMVIVDAMPALEAINEG